MLSHGRGTNLQPRLRRAGTLVPLEAREFASSSPLRLWGASSEGLTLAASDPSRNYTLTTEVVSAVDVPVAAVWFYSAPGATRLPDAIGLFRCSDTTTVATDAAPVWSGVAGSGWVWAPLTATLTAGAAYKVAAFRNAAGGNSTNDWYSAVADYFTTSGRTNGILSSPRLADAHVGNGVFRVGGTTIGYPDDSFGAPFYGVDLEVLAPN